MPKRKICVVTGSRAEYGLLHSLLKDFQKTLGQVHHSYKSGNASKAINKTLKSFNLDGILAKGFYDLKL